MSLPNKGIPSKFTCCANSHSALLVEEIASSAQRKLEFGVSIALLFLSLLGAACSRGVASPATNENSPAQAKTKLKVQVAIVEQQPHQRMVEAVGSLFAHDEVTVSSEAEGRVEEVFFDVGDRVAKGQVLARISPVEMQLTV